MSFDLSAYVDMFREEAEGYLARLTEGLLALERQPDDAARVHEVFRAAHSLKGAARMLELGDIADLAHALEDLLDGVRSGRTALTTALVNALLAAVDALGDLVRVVGTADAPRVSAQTAAATLRALREQSGHQTAPAGQPGPAGQPEPSAPPAGPDHLRAAAAPPSGAAPPSAPAAPGAAEATPALAPPPERPAAEPAVAQARVSVPVERLDRLLRLSAQLLTRREGDRAPVVQARALVRALAAAQTAAAAQPGAVGQTGTVGQAAPAHPSLFRALVEARLAAEQLARASAADAGTTAALAEELYYEASRARMVPVESLFRGFQRLVRDGAQVLGKQVELVLEGTDTELDKRLLDVLHDALMHLVTNALDHGVEPPEVRVAQAKPARGAIRLAARPHGERVLIEVADDGAGLDPQRLREAAVRRGLLSAEGAAALTDGEAIGLMFRAGFSTREHASPLSGRGVGMDVVRTTVDALEGQIRVSSERGRGTLFTISVPLSVATMRVLLVQVPPGAGQPEPQTYALPASAVERCEWLASGAIQTHDGQYALDLEGRRVQVRSLAALLGLPATWDGPSVLLRDGDARLLLTVDTLVGEAVIVVEPLGPLLRGVRSVTGGAILPDGSVALVLSLPYLLWAVPDPPPAAPAPASRRRRVLVVDDVLMTRELERAILAGAGYEVETAGDGSAALDRLARGGEPAVDAVVTDVEMPGMGGLELVAAIRAGRAGGRHADVPIVVVSSHERPEERAAGLAAGAQAYLPKSAFDQGTLLDALRSSLGVGSGAAC